MVLIYIIVIGIVTTLGLTCIIQDFLTLKKPNIWGYVLFGSTFLIHDMLLSLLDERIPVTVKGVEYIVFYMISFLIIFYFFSGDCTDNFIWIYGANFIYQAMATVYGFLMIGFLSGFRYKGFEDVLNTPNMLSYIILFITTLTAVPSAVKIIKVLRKRRNRVIQITLGTMAFIGILAGAINSSVSLYIIFPMMSVLLFVGIYYQDKRIKQIEKQELYYKELENKQRIRNEELAKIRHDLANHISIIDETHDVNYSQEVLNVIKEELKSGVSIIDGLLDDKERRCREKEICLNEELTDVSGSRISNYDWVSLLANLLDNAIEACERALDCEKRIDLKLRRSGAYVIVKLTNSKCADERPKDNKFATTKQKKQEHGYGTRIVKDIVEKYDGRIQYEDSGASMNVDIILLAWHVEK